MHTNRPGRFSATLLTVALGCAGRGVSPPPAPESEAGMSAAARGYLLAALDTIEQNVMRAEGVSWSRIRDSALIIAEGAQRPFDTYPAIDWAARRANKHSFLQVPATPGAVSTLLEGRIGYIHVPQRGGTAVSLADSLHRAVGALQDSGACGWIVDVRANGGGNMWPMLAGVGPLLGDTLVGSFGGQQESPRWYYRNGLSGILFASGRVDTITRVTVPPVQPRNAAAPVAVLFDAGTGSSGEAVVIAFLGRPGTRSFGSPSAGFATVNRGARLADGANLVITTGHNADRLGRVYGDQLQPDSQVALPTGWPSSTDRVTAAALRWLNRSTLSCSSPGPAP
jgi:hypothetical protein